MEEILASIRRIIEDSDPQRQTANDDAPAAVAASARPAPAEDEAEAFRAELQGPPERTAPSLSETASTPPPAERRAAPVAQLRPTPPGDDMALRAGDAAPRRIEPEIIPAPVVRAVSPERVEPKIETRIETPRAEPQAAPAPKPDSLALDRPALKQSIISEQAGRQVAAAFGELSDAFAASRRKSFDEMAEEMMRPMLQDWMDNNLPLLVERLVREEIERVARGAG